MRLQGIGNAYPYAQRGDASIVSGRLHISLSPARSRGAAPVAPSVDKDRPADVADVSLEYPSILPYPGYPPPPLSPVALRVREAGASGGEIGGKERERTGAADEDLAAADDLDRKESGGEPEAGGETSGKGQSLDERQQAQVRELKARDREVRAHEQAHMAVGGRYAGGVSYEYQLGPDGNRYAVGGEVSIDVSPEREPADTIAKMRQVRAAALAPANPSEQDRAVAAQASRNESQAHVEQRLRDVAALQSSLEEPRAALPVMERETARSTGRNGMDGVVSRGEAALSGLRDGRSAAFGRTGLAPGPVLLDVMA